MSDTIFYKGKLKRGKNHLDVYEKLAKQIKKKGPTKNWICEEDSENRAVRIMFGDGRSEDFVLAFTEKGEFDSFCKVDFPLEGELFEEGKSEFKALLDMLYKAKALFNSIEITDDFSLAESYMESKRIKFELRKLTPDEEERVKRIYSKGYTTHESLLRAIMAEDMNMEYDEFCNYLNPNTVMYDSDEPGIVKKAETYLYETAGFRDEGKLCEIPHHIYSDLGVVAFSTYAFCVGMSWIFFDGTGSGTEINLEKQRSFTAKDAQVGVFFRERFGPIFMKETDLLERCMLAYRYFLSVYDYLGFVFVGR